MKSRLQDWWSLYVRCLPLLLPAVLLILGPVYLLNRWAWAGSVYDPDVGAAIPGVGPGWMLTIRFLGGGIAYPLFLAVLAAAVARVLGGGRPTLWPALRAGVSRWGTLVALWAPVALAGLATQWGIASLWMDLLVHVPVLATIPVNLVLLALLVPIYDATWRIAVEGVGPLQALHRSLRSVRGGWGTCWAVLAAGELAGLALFHGLSTTFLWLYNVSSPWVPWPLAWWLTVSGALQGVAGRLLDALVLTALLEVHLRDRRGASCTTLLPSATKVTNR